MRPSPARASDDVGESPSGRTRQRATAAAALAESSDSGRARSRPVWTRAYVILRDHVFTYSDSPYKRVWGREDSRRPSSRQAAAEGREAEREQEPRLRAGSGVAAVREAAVHLQGCSVRKGQLETPNHSVFLIKCVSSCPFLAEHPCTGFGRMVASTFAPPLTHLVPNSLIESVPLFLRRQCGRALRCTSPES